MAAAGKTPARKTPAAKKAAPRRAAPARAAKPPVKAAAPAPAAKAAPVPKPPKADKPRKPKLVRDSFTIPKAEYAVLEELKKRAASLAHPSKKSEVLRAGIKALSALPDSALLEALKAVPAIKTGRPKSEG